MRSPRALGRWSTTEIREIAQHSARYVALSHYHGHDVLGAGYFPTGVTTISHARTRENMRRIYIENALPGLLPHNIEAVYGELLGNSKAVR